MKVPHMLAHDVTSYNNKCVEIAFEKLIRYPIPKCVAPIGEYED